MIRGVTKSRFPYVMDRPANVFIQSNSKLPARDDGTVENGWSAGSAMKWYMPVWRVSLRCINLSLNVEVVTWCVTHCERF